MRDRARQHHGPTANSGFGRCGKCRAISSLASGDGSDSGPRCEWIARRRGKRRYSDRAQVSSAADERIEDRLCRWSGSARSHEEISLRRRQVAMSPLQLDESRTFSMAIRPGRRRFGGSAQAACLRTDDLRSPNKDHADRYGLSNQEGPREWFGTEAARYLPAEVKSPPPTGIKCDRAPVEEGST